MSNFIDKTTKLMLEKRGNYDHSVSVNLNRSINYADLLYTKNSYYCPEDTFSMNQSILSSRSNNPSKMTIKKGTYNIETDFSDNAKMVEYYTKMKTSIRSLFLCSIFADKDVFNIDENDLCCSLTKLLEFIPELGLIFKLAGIKCEGVTMEDLKLKLTAVSDLAVHYDNLPENLAKMMVLIKRDIISKMVEPFDENM